jgi:orotidine-5'-phosphate decarboxylase
VSLGIFAQPTEPKDRLIFALDVDDFDHAERLVKDLSPHVGMIKVGPRMFTGYGEQIVKLIQDRGAKLFLDLKFHDIPDTVAGAAREVARLRARMFTVHALGGAEMIKKAAGALNKMTIIPGMPHALCIAVTLLTSHTEDEARQLGFAASLVDQTVKLAKLAIEAGAAGVVSSGHELKVLRGALPSGVIYVVPGIRGPDDAKGDQARTMSAREAVEAGATYVVIGRPIREADDPVGAAKRIVEEIGKSAAPK